MTGIPVVGIIFIATTIKTINLVRYHGFLKKLSFTPFRCFLFYAHLGEDNIL